MSAVLNFTQSIETTTCAHCGTVFGMAPHLLASKRQDRGAFYCPNGHQLSFTESVADRLKKQLDAANKLVTEKETALVFQRSRADEAERAEANVSARLRRIKNGVCPCCKRSFTALRRHIKTKHPEWKP